MGLGNGARVQEAHPLLQGLDLAGLDGETPSVGGVPGWAHVVLGNVQGPLVMEGKIEGRPVVALTFDPVVSGLEKSLAFPLLISNATSYLLLQADTANASAGTSEPFESAESDIAPRPLPSFVRPPATRTVEVVGGPDFAERWKLPLAAALVVLGAEWLVFARRG